MTFFPGLKARLIAYNTREQARRENVIAHRHRDEAARETAAAIAAVIEARVPLSRGHLCAELPWCPWCTKVDQSRKDAAIARRIGGAV